MPKIIDEDMIEKIAQHAEKGHSKAETARETGLDRKTVGKYWPKKEEPRVKKEDEEGKTRLSIEEEFNLLNKKAETDYELESLLNKIKGLKWETESLKARGKAAVVGIEFLREKLDKASLVTEVDEVRELAAGVKNDVTALLDQNEPLRKQRQEQKVKKEEGLMQTRLNELAWLFPCRRDQAKKIVDRLVWNDDVDRIGALYHVGLLLMMAEDLEWENDTSDLKPLVTECANLLRGNWEEAERIMDVEYRRKKRILIPSDEDMEGKYLHMLDLLTTEVYERSVEMVFKFNAALSRLADERFIDTEELVRKENPPAKVKVAGKGK